MTNWILRNAKCVTAAITISFDYLTKYKNEIFIGEAESHFVGSKMDRMSPKQSLHIYATQKEVNEHDL